MHRVIPREKRKVILMAAVVTIISAAFSGYCLYRLLLVGPQVTVGPGPEGTYEGWSTLLALGLVFLGISVIKIWLEVRDLPFSQ